MADKVRLPNGEVFEKSALEEGLECRRCESFIPMEAAERPKPGVQRYEMEVKGFAVTDQSKRHHTTRGGGDDITAILCPGCRRKLGSFLAGGRVKNPREEYIGPEGENDGS